MNLRELIGRATKGDWAIDRDDRPGMHWNNHIVERDRPRMTVCFMTHDGTRENARGEANAELIVYLRNNAERLLAVVEAAEELLANDGGRGLYDAAACIKAREKLTAALAALAEPGK